MELCLVLPEKPFKYNCYEVSIDTGYYCKTLDYHLNEFSNFVIAEELICDLKLLHVMKANPSIKMFDKFPFDEEISTWTYQLKEWTLDGFKNRINGGWNVIDFIVYDISISSYNEDGYAIDYEIKVTND